MSSVTMEPAKKQPRSKAKEKRQGQSKANGTERLKTVVRRLPPTLPEQIFWQSVQAWVTDDSVIWKEYWPGKVKKKYVPVRIVVFGDTYWMVVRWYCKAEQGERALSCVHRFQDRRIRREVQS
jgi:pentatricopeptide repeat protein